MPRRRRRRRLCSGNRRYGLTNLFYLNLNKCPAYVSLSLKEIVVSTLKEQFT